MFVLENVTKRYGETAALEPVSLSIRRGERVALLGPSGSGKTTFLHLIAGVIRPEEGAIFVDGRALSDLDHGPELAGLVGIIHQQFDLVPHLSVIHNVMAGRLGEWGLFRSLASLVSPRQRELAEEALGEVGLPHKIRERTSRLSGGEQQRVAIARLLVQAPEAVLADEPVASLDPARAEDLVELLVRLTEVRERTLVASLHNVGLARRHFTRAIGLRNVRVVFDVRADELSDGMLRDLYDLTGLEGEDDGRADAPEAPRDAAGQAAPHAPAAAGVPVELHRRRVE